MFYSCCSVGLDMFRLKMPAAKKEAKKKAVTNEVVTREYTINVHKRIHGMYVLHFDRLSYYQLHWSTDSSDLVHDQSIKLLS